MRLSQQSTAGVELKKMGDDHVHRALNDMRIDRAVVRTPRGVLRIVSCFSFLNLNIAMHMVVHF
jgi:hypothetical protein